MAAIAATTSTFITVWPAISARPTSSTLNAAAKQVVSNSTLTTIDRVEPRQFKVYNSAGTTGFIADVAGVYEYDSVPTAAQPIPTPLGAFQ